MVIYFVRGCLFWFLDTWCVTPTVLFLRAMHHGRPYSSVRQGRVRRP